MLPYSNPMLLALEQELRVKANTQNKTGEKRKFRFLPRFVDLSESDDNKAVNAE